MSRVLWQGAIFIGTFAVFSIIAFLFIHKNVDIRKNPAIINELNRKHIAKNKPTITAEEFYKVYRKERLLKSGLNGLAVATAVTVAILTTGTFER